MILPKLPLPTLGLVSLAILGLALVSIFTSRINQIQGRTLWTTVDQSGFEDAQFSDWDQISASSGTFTQIAEDTEVPPTGLANSLYLAKAYQDGSTNTSIPHFSRSVWEYAGIGSGEYRKMTASFYLPTGFYSSMEGAVQLMGYDAFPASSNQYRIAIYNFDKNSYIFVNESGQGRNILKGPQLPEGQWFDLSVETYFSDTDGWSRMYVDGALVAETGKYEGCAVGLDTCEDTMPDEDLTRARYGIVAIADGIQSLPLMLYLDGANLAEYTGSQPPAPPGCHYEQVWCFSPPCDPILVCN